MKNFTLLLVFISEFSIGQDTTKMKQLYNQAMAFEDKGDFDNAIKTQINLLRLDTNNYVSANVIAGLFGKKGMFTTEIQWAKKSIQINPKFSDAYINLGNGYLGFGNIEMAEKCFKQSQKLDSTNPFSYYSLGVIQETKKDLQSAILYYEKSVQVNPTFIEGYFNLAAAYANMKQFKKANENISKVLKLNPNDKEAQGMQKEILLDLKKSQ